MPLADDKAERWEAGCQIDPVRNDFIIPNIATIMNQFNPKNIIDIGTGTGYIPRMVNRLMDKKPHWMLIDINIDRLNIAKNLSPPDMKLDIICTDFMLHKFSQRFEAAIITFTILEVDSIHLFTEKLTEMVLVNGIILITIPDSWQDIIKHSADYPGILCEFLSGTASIPRKVDKFTKEYYPFKAVRTEYLVGRMLSLGFELVELRESGDDGTRNYLLCFRWRGLRQ